LNYPNVDDKVKIIEGDHKGKTGIILDEFKGWNFIQYTVCLQENDKIYTFYHDEIELTH